MEQFLKDFLEPVTYLMYAGLVYNYSRFDKSVRIKNLFGYYLFTGFFLTIGQLLKENNWVYNLFFFITVVFFSYFFYTILSAAYKKVVLIFCVANILLFLLNDVALKQIFQENNYLRSFYFFTIIMYALLYLYETIKEVNETNMLEQFEFWLVSGYLLYFLGCLCIVLYYKYPTAEQRGKLWIIQSVILFCSWLITCSGTLWLLMQKKYQ